MNGTTRRPVMRRPFIRPQTAAGGDAAQSGGHERAGAGAQQDAITTVVSAMTEPDGQIDAARHDNHRHAEGGDADDRGLPRHQLEIGAG